ncbi:MAG: HlyD family efflux transporter periplasmic adaptor subunit [Pirellulales bacterium]|nr:HlyD family efflux transporter periplasmic adaptor subunit [Pirellulales bacterium]
MKRIIILAAVVILLAIGGFAFSRLSTGVPVEAARAQVDKIAEFVDEQAKTRLPTVYEITMPFDGRILPIELTEGMPVSQGQLVAQLVPKDVELDVAAAEAAVSRLDASLRENNDISVEETTLAQTKQFVESMDRTVEAATERLKAGEARLGYAEKNLGRVQKLAEQNVKSAEELDQAQTQFVERNVEYKQDNLTLRAMEAMQAATALTPTMARQYIDRKRLSGDVLERQKLEAEIKLQQVEQDKQRSVMASPVSGTILERHVTNERPVAAGTVLVSIGDLSQLEVEVDVLSQDVVNIKEGDTVEFMGPAVGKPTAHGTVKTIYPAGFTKVSSLGVEQQRVRVIVQFLPEDLQRLRSERGLGVGYRLDARIFTRSKPEALVVPRSALFRGADDGWQLYVIRNGVARLQPVSVGLMNDQRVEITQGIEIDDLVVLAPETTLTDGTRVIPVVRD